MTLQQLTTALVGYLRDYPESGETPVTVNFNTGPRTYLRMPLNYTGALKDSGDVWRVFLGADYSAVERR
jgi:hypothetical protein